MMKYDSFTVNFCKEIAKQEKIKYLSEMLRNFQGSLRNRVYAENKG